MHVLKVLPSPLTYKVITREDAEDVALFSIKTTVQLSLSRDTNAHTQSINGMFFIVFHNINMIFILYVKNGLYVIRFYFFCIPMYMRIGIGYRCVWHPACLCQCNTHTHTHTHTECICFHLQKFKNILFGEYIFKPCCLCLSLNLHVKWSPIVFLHFDYLLQPTPVRVTTYPSTCYNLAR